MGVASINYMVQINNEFKEIAEEEMPIMELMTEITIHKLEQTNWFNRALRHIEIAALGQEDNKINMKLHQETKDEFKKKTIKINEEIDNAIRMSNEGQELSYTEHLKKELKLIEESLKSIKEEYEEYNEYAAKLFALFENGKIIEAEKLITETEKLEDTLNHKLEALLIEIEKFTRYSLVSVGEHEDKAVFIMAALTIISLLFMGTVLSFIAISGLFGRIIQQKKE